MIKTILGWVMVGMILAVVVLLFINGGGLSSIRQTASSVPSLRDFIFGVASSSTQFQLPGQEDITTNLGIDPNFEEIYGNGSAGGTVSASNQSVVIEASSVQATNAAEEYVVLYASSANSAAVDISGWSIVSASRGTRLVIPLAAPLFVPGSASRVQSVSLAPGDQAVVYTGISPIGVSYRENFCSMYLSHMPSYASCVKEHQAESNFQSGTWRLYAGYTSEVWRESDTLRLIDGQGRFIAETRY